MNTDEGEAAVDKPIHIIRTRDDAEPIRFIDTDSSDSDSPSFQLTEATRASWADEGKPFGTETLRGRIEPWLTALFQSEHLSLLLGSGLTTAVHSCVTDKPAPSMDRQDFTPFDTEINAEATRAATVMKRGSGNLEDQVRAATELLRGLEILEEKSLDGKTMEDLTSELRNSIDGVLRRLTEGILEIERNLWASPTGRDQAFGLLVNFLMSFASRTGTRERLHIFTTNYDRYIEAGSEIAGLRLIDRFIGTLMPIFRASRLDVDLHYNPPGIRGEPRYLEGVARFTKLHGSIDWIADEHYVRRQALPFGAQALDEYLNPLDESSWDMRSLMVYPNSAKDSETAAYPYVELFRDFASAICRPNSTVITYGYSFGDEHLNRAIRDMLTIPSSHLVIIAYGDTLGRVLNLYDTWCRPAQITLLLGNHLADLHNLVQHYLPKPAIDRASIRMTELLRSRGAQYVESSGSTDSDASTEAPSQP